MLSIATDAVPGRFEHRLDAISAAGFDAIDLSATDVAQFDGSLKGLAGLITAKGLSVASFGPLPTGTSRAHIVAKMKTAAQLGAPIVIIEATNGILPELPEPEGMKLALRPDRATEEAVVEYVARADNPNIGLALDAYCVLEDASRPARLRHLNAAQVFHVSLTDGPRRRMLPGQGTLNLGGIARVLARAGYAGPYAVGFGLDGGTSVLNAYRSLANVLSDTAQTEPALRAAAPDLPPKVPVTGVEFIEFAVDAASAEELERVLATLAFRKERQHVSKDVSLWRQGAVNIVVNKEGQGHAAAAFAEHGPCVCDLGLRVLDADLTVARARALGSDAFAQSVGMGELDIPAIRGVGGSVIHFIDEQSNLHRVWDIEFTFLPQHNTPPPSGLRRIDHIAQTMRFDEMQSWLLFYLTTFEMTKTRLVHVADPSGIVKSQALQTPEGEVRLNLNGAADAQTLAGAFVSGKPGAGVQHVAFLTDDIFETSRHLSTSGFARLQIPQSYYDDTQAAFGLSDEVAANLRHHNILYDADDQGAYFQLYGETLFDGFFIEVVQRTGRYAGYGARNAPIRLAAQAQTGQRKGAA